jgi:AI-2 transport protein TqsA
VFIALLLSVLLVYLIDPLVVLLQRRRVPLWTAAIISTAFFAALLSGLGVLLVIDLARFGRSFPRFQAEILERVSAGFEGLESALGLPLVNPFEDLQGFDAGPLVMRGARSAMRLLSEGLLVLFFAVILLLGKYQVVRVLLRSFPRRHSLVPILLRHVDRHLRTFLGIKTISSLVIGILTAGILLAFRVEFAVTWGALSVVLNFVPAVGPIAAIVAPVLIAAVQFDTLLLPLAVAASLAVLHVVVSNFLEPRFMGERLDLSFFVIFVSLLFWGWMWGPAGIILAVPITASLKIVLDRIPATARIARLLGRARGLGRRPKPRG